MLVSVITSPNLLPVQLQATRIVISEVPLHQQVLPIHTVILSGFLLAPAAAVQAVLAEVSKVPAAAAAAEAQEVKHF